MVGGLVDFLPVFQFVHGLLSWSREIAFSGSRSLLDDGRLFASLVEGLVSYPFDLNVRRTFTRGWEITPLHRIVFRRSCADLVKGYLEVN